MFNLKIALVIITLINLLKHVVSREFNWNLGNTSVWLSAVAYCNATNYFTQDYLYYSEGFIPLYTLVEPVYDTQGYIGIMPSQSLIYVIFRGSTSFQDWLDDLDAVLTSYPYCKKCEVHKGFYKTEQAFISNITTQVQLYLNDFYDYKVLVTGHSLGAALATLTAVDLQASGIDDVILYNYGSPRIGNDEFASFVSSYLTDINRVTHHKDTVPHTPMHERFTHLSGEWYQDDSGLKECFGYEDSTCSYQWHITSVSDHMNYLNIYMGCDPLGYSN